MWVTSHFQEIDCDSTSNWRRIWLWTRLYDLNCYPELKPEINVFSMAWPRLSPRPFRAARNCSPQDLHTAIHIPHSGSPQFRLLTSPFYPLHLYDSMVFNTSKRKYKKEFTYIAYVIHNNSKDCKKLCNGWAYSTNGPIRLILNSVTFNCI
jgi:hypothetical protein